MVWFDVARINFASTSSVVTDSVVDKDGCDVVFETTPMDSLVLDVDEVSAANNLVKSVIGSDKQCDFAILSVENDENIIALLEVTDQNTNLPEKIYECMKQLIESFDHFDSISHRCALPIAEVTRKAVIVAPYLRSTMFKSQKFDTERRHFIDNVAGSVALVFVQCGEDVWQEIQGTSTT